jgi:ParB family chromosome partitioning protein
LSALLGESEAEGEGEGVSAREIPLELIRRNPDQPRRQFVEADLEELTASIREKGVLQPVLLRPAPGVTGEYQLVAGERRWRAAQRAGLRTIPAVIRELDDQQVLEIAIVENVQRADLNALEEAQGYKALIDRFGRTQEAVAQVVGKSRPHVANALRLLSLPEPVLALLADGTLSAGHARALVGADDPTGLAQLVAAKGLNVRETEALAKRTARGGGARPSQPRPPGKDADTLSLENDLAAVLGMTVDLQHDGGKGELRIAYETLEQLDDLCRRLMRG